MKAGFIVFLVFVQLPLQARIAYGTQGDMLSGARNTTYIADLLSYPLFIFSAKHTGGYGTYFFHAFVIIPIYSYFKTLQHEYFGHAYRARQYHRKNDLIMKAPFPYNLFIEDNIAVAGYVKVTFDTLPTYDERLLLDAAGIEANNIAAKDYRIPMLKGKSLFYNYLISRLSPFGYILGDSGQISGGFEGDPSQYRLALKQKYNDNNALSVVSMRWQSLWYLLDPFLWTYVSDAMKPWPIGKELKFTFSTNYYLSPYGPEFQLDFYLIKKKTIWIVTPRYGHGVKYINGGLSVVGRNIIRVSQIGFGMDAHTWYQPKANNGLAETTMSFGGGFALQAEWYFNPTYSLEAMLGYKTAGFLPGRSLDSETYFFIGLNMPFDLLGRDSRLDGGND
ncbi:MAG: hypothetical protein D6767_07400 [Candidatus Hydrogenedentota bacterium]|nr:MAG: hypothetical protein D6767_07400 [Candidatus Hydrogenedentota bacterium]